MTELDKVIKIIKELTEENNHTRARRVAARDLLFDYTLSCRFQTIEDKADKLGHMTYALIMERSELSDKLFSMIEKRFTKKQVTEIKSAF